jgi:hypothetical protein
MALTSDNFNLKRLSCGKESADRKEFASLSRPSSEFAKKSKGTR